MRFRVSGDLGDLACRRALTEAPASGDDEVAVQPGSSWTGMMILMLVMVVC